MHLFTSTVGRKILMAVTGLLLVGFITIHLIGNLTIFAGNEAINIYAAGLHSMPPVVWIFRLVILVLFAIHITFGIQLTVENSAATPEQYAIQVTQKTTFAAKSMIYTGLIILAFILYHLLHFTMHVVHTDAIEPYNQLVNGRHNVFGMVGTSFQSAFITIAYAIAIIALAFHLTHGLQSFIQTLGWSNGPSQDKVSAIGKLVAIAYGVLYVAIPLAFLFHILKV
ncbi:succinate dehydrogenase subunit C [Malonomonas rubra DSM 5091]|uniref:Succinate dehydrogenase subunit C n=1 Tax=Malonomonas rubra DSM 5091 TaxID=1122189 RepID=A0A1M6BWY1_MALRU|nr:succinate dehydrogenase cytochrome b subunit [Malonomonas rubra]SHI53246.1 succinate dehydrogenase subunit C [Malonomonas rubra DSM 5091]